MQTVHTCAAATVMTNLTDVSGSLTKPLGPALHLRCLLQGAMLTPLLFGLWRRMNQHAHTTPPRRTGGIRTLPAPVHCTMSAAMRSRHTKACLDTGSLFSNKPRLLLTGGDHMWRWPTNRCLMNHQTTKSDSLYLNLNAIDIRSHDYFGNQGWHRKRKLMAYRVLLYVNKEVNDSCCT